MKISRLPAIVLMSHILLAPLYAQPSGTGQTGWNGISVSGQWFLAHQNEWSGTDYSNQFFLRRGYVTFSKKFNDAISVRFTQDITTDREGSDAGNIEMRLKYLYIKVSPGFQPIPWLSHTYLEFGMVHRPWLDFEEKINRYRLQGTMYGERSGLLNSADFGVTWVGLLGGKIDSSFQRDVNSAYPGKYGSVALGVYNGGGYHALEMNNNKTVEARLSLRPFPGRIPGLQFSYSLASGKGNLPENPAWVMHLGAMTFSSARFRAVAQAVKGKGNSFGTYVDEAFRALPMEGFALFGEWMLRKDLSVIGRYDRLNVEASSESDPLSHTIGGICYHFMSGQKVMVDLDLVDDGNGRQRILEVVMEIRF